MIRKIDIESDEFQTELELTKQFTNKVCEEHGFFYNPEDDVNESIQMGLTRNKLIYGKRYCPCFMVVGETQEEKDKADNRLCPCTPALTKEIPSKGHCHCAIFCTKEYVDDVLAQQTPQSEEKKHSLGLTKKQCEDLLLKPEVNAAEVEALLEARNLGFVDFLLVDTREWMEWIGGRIVGTDYLVPTTSFYQSLEQIENKKETPIILYCHSGSRSAYCQRIMLSSGFKTVINLDYGIMTYQGEIVAGE
ncbi:ferredoxin-thioredoxin reductase catalytic domain-containing protein [Halarcobacter ebronensis]|uniref:ferredoxin:thioredoxin reductase n=1 Tax=Halarcobacter ebronensis TaxID=1462615 RepID=A0A4Q1APW4_9BACT|nr:ferredoxin-thioredoxin reductase catalytic domain-containing protein [Halarcobacter ebronensis]QKF82877.1 FeThRed_B, RHOD domain-containing protein [Halarcobacter ebronensis]RXK06895.1 sulfurtransferase [Halarcobacter ebronensis]